MLIRIRPLSDLNLLTETETDVGNCSDRVYVPNALFMQWIGTRTVSLSILNGEDQEVKGTMFQPHSKDANTIYGPDWMLSALEKDVDRCHVKPVELPPCTALTLQPHNEEDVEDMELLQLALERYSSISPGQELILWHPYGYPFVVRVSAAEPDHPWVSIAYADIPLTMEPPLVSTVVPVAATEAVATEAVATEAVATEAVATVAAATATATATNLRQQCFEAARRRMEAKEKSE